jgi:hypothetical protein
VDHGNLCCTRMFVDVFLVVTMARTINFVRSSLVNVVISLLSLKGSQGGQVAGRLGCM